MANLVKCSNAQEVPAKEVFRTLNVVVTMSLIQSCQEFARVVFFVDNINGESYGSYDSQEQAEELSKEMQLIIEA